MITPVAPLWFRLPAPAAERWLALPRISTARGTEVCAIEVGLALKRATGAETIRRYVIVVVGLLVRPFMPPTANRSARTAITVNCVRASQPVHLIDQTDDPVRGDLWMARGLQGSSVERGTVGKGTEVRVAGFCIAVHRERCSADCSQETAWRIGGRVGLVQVRARCAHGIPLDCRQLR